MCDLPFVNLLQLTSYIRLIAISTIMKQEISDKVQLSKLHTDHEHNIQDNAKAVKDYLNGNVGTYHPNIPKTISGIQDITNAIMELQCLRDNSQGITWAITEHQDGTKTLIRDARSRKPEIKTPMNYPDSFKIQYLASLRAAINLLDDEVKKIQDLEKIKDSGVNPGSRRQAISTVTEKKAEIFARAQQVVNGKFEVGKDNIVELNTRLANYLTIAGIENAASKLETTREFGNFYDTHHHISTITSVQNGKGESCVQIESDVMALGNTPNMKLQYQAIKEAMVAKDALNPKSIFQQVKCEGQDMGWFNKLPIYQKQLIINHIDTLIEGTKIIPTQLRKVLPGIRNAYTKATYVQQPGEEGLTLAVRTAHIGTPSFHPKHLKEGEAQIITTENLVQAQAIFAGTDKGVTCNILNSPINPSGIDKSIERQVINGINALSKVGNELLSSVTTPFNILRTVSRNDVTQFDKNLKTIAEKVCSGPTLKEVKKYLEGKGSYKKALGALDKDLIDMPDVKKMLASAIEARRGINTSRAFNDPENTNLKIVSAMKQVSSLANSPEASDQMRKFQQLKDIRGNQIFDIPIIITNCASGKDRTGVAEFETSRQAVNQILGVTDPNIAKDNMIRQARAGHTQTMASVNGGTRGCDGIKKDTLGAMPKKFYETIREGLMQFTASFNKFKCMDKYLLKLENTLCPKSDKEVNKIVVEDSKGKDTHAARILASRSSGAELTLQ